ncbi:MAG TPA: mechanosensitive ion channel domain-containing protein [Methylomirabilota bacterium]|nr:mechanosensitive ion channel domain-containing protein [Methylomirabilota bacterium]
MQQAMSAFSAKDVTIDLLIRYGFQLLGAAVILVIGVLAARSVGNMTGRWLERRAFEPPMRTLVVRAVKIVVLIFTLVVALDKFGFQIAPLVAGIGVAGLGIGIALQGVLSNVVAGLSIILTKPFRVGEWIKLVGVDGEVTAIELFSTTLIHPDRSRVVIPNRKIVGEVLHNFGKVRQLDLKVGIGYGADVAQAVAAAREVLASNPRVLKEPAALVGVTGLGDSAVVLTLAPWVSVADFVSAQAELYQALLARFRASRIDIPFPQREVRLLKEA